MQMMDTETPGSQPHNQNPKRNVLGKSLSVGKVFLPIYSLLAVAFILIFIIGSTTATGGDSGLESWALLINGFFIVPAAFGLVFVVHMIVLAFERKRSQTAQAITAPPETSVLSSSLKAALIALLVFFVGIMLAGAIFFTLR
jgi:hypothetical protein